MALIITCKYISSLSIIAYIIQTCPIKGKLLNYLPIVQACSKNLMMGAMNVKLCSLRYENCNGSSASIKHIEQHYRCLFLLFITFATNSGIVMAIALLVAAISTKVQYNRSRAWGIMRNFKTNQRAAIILHRFSSCSKKLGRLSWTSLDKGNKKVGTKQKSSQNTTVFSFQFGIVVRCNTNLTISAGFIFFIAKYKKSLLLDNN